MSKARIALIVAAAVIAVGCGSGSRVDKAIEDAQSTPATHATTYVVTDPATTQPVQSAKPVDRELENATGAARDYLNGGSGFSRQGLIDQLTSDFGDGFPRKVATAAVDSLHVDWNEQAALAARGYLESGHFSRKGLIEQLESNYGAQFTHAQAVYGVKKAGL